MSGVGGEVMGDYDTGVRCKECGCWLSATGGHVWDSVHGVISDERAKNAALLRERDELLSLKERSHCVAEAIDELFGEGQIQAMILKRAHEIETLRASSHHESSAGKGTGPMLPPHGGNKGESIPAPVPKVEDSPP